MYDKIVHLTKSMSKIKPLELSAKALCEFLEKETILYAKCGLTGRELRIRLFGKFQIIKDGVVLFDGIVEPLAAVELFSSI